MRRLLRILSYGIATIIVILSGWMVLRHAQGDNILSVQTGSMVPAFYPGDAVWTRGVLLQDLHVGEIVAYRSPANPRVVVSHRIIGVNHSTGKIITIGDALELQDVPFSYTMVVGKVHKVIPHIGTALDFLHNPVGLLAIVYAPSAVIIMSELRRLYMRCKQPYYQLYSYTLGYR